MRIPQLSSLLVAAALTTAPSVVAADPTPVHETISATTPSDTAQYTAREAKDTPVAKFRGGGEVVVVGSTTALVVLLLVLVIVL